MLYMANLIQAKNQDCESYIETKWGRLTVKIQLPPRFTDWKREKSGALALNAGLIPI